MFRIQFVICFKLKNILDHCCLGQLQLLCLGREKLPCKKWGSALLSNRFHQLCNYQQHDNHYKYITANPFLKFPYNNINFKKQLVVDFSYIAGLIKEKNGLIFLVFNYQPCERNNFASANGPAHQVIELKCTRNQLFNATTCMK